jgi:hypothetical protein
MAQGIAKPGKENVGNFEWLQLTNGRLFRKDEWVHA